MLSGAAWVPNNGGPLRRVRSVKHEHGHLWLGTGESKPETSEGEAESH